MIGALAQLGERMTGSHEVRGSIPLCSTTIECPFATPKWRRGYFFKPVKIHEVKMSKQEPSGIPMLEARSKTARAAILTMTTLAGCGHPGGSMSSIDILNCLYYSIHHNPANPFMEGRDKVVVSIGHISPAVYSILALNGYFPLEDAITGYRVLHSPYEGHIEREVLGVEWTTGNLGQGLSAAVGMALAAKLKKSDAHVYVLMGDGEQQKGQLSEARRLAAKYQLNKLVAIVDYNRLQISGSINDVMPQNIRKSYEADGWMVLEVNGHDFEQILSTLAQAKKQDKPVMILAHTIMGKGVDFMENQAKFHGSALKPEQLEEALKQLGEPNRFEEYQKIRSQLKPSPQSSIAARFALETDLQAGQPIVYEDKTDNRSAWGAAIKDLGLVNKDAQTPIAVLDCDLSGSVKTDGFAKAFPDRFFQTGIMEHNTAVVAGAISSCNIQSFWADFGMFGIAEVYNMQRLNDINHANLKTVLTHVGIDVGEDGKTHQSVDYISLCRSLPGFRLILPADPNHTDRIIRWLIDKPGNYIVAMGRSKIPIIKQDSGELVYPMEYSFEYGQADLLREGNQGCVLVCGTPVANAIKAVDTLREQGIFTKLYYISSPLSLTQKLLEDIAQAGKVVTIEDHLISGGLGTTLADSMAEKGLSAKILKIGVDKYPPSGPSDELYRYYGLDSAALSKKIGEWV